MTSRVQSTLALTVLGMEGCWLFALVALASVVLGQNGPALSFVGVLVLLGAAYWVAWVLEGVDLPLAALQLISAVVGAVLVTAVAQIHTLGPAGLEPWNPVWLVPAFGRDLTSPELVAATVSVGAGVLLWWRGVRLTQRDHGFEPVLGSFRIGFGVVSLEALLEAFLAPAVSSAWIALPFFTLGLIALSLSHFEEVGQGNWAASVRRWVWLPPVVIGAMAVVAASVGMGVFAWAWSIVRAFFSLIDRAVSTVFFAVLLLFGFIAELLVEGLRALLAWLGPRGSEPVLQQMDDLLKDLQREPQTEIAWLRFVGYLIVGALVVLIGGSILLWLARALGRRRDRERGPGDEERESLWTEGALGEELQDLAGRLLGRFRRGQDGVSLASLGRDPRAILLWVYYQLLRLAERRGVQRPAWQTPSEFQAGLATAFPGADVRVARITRGFVSARYDPSPPAMELAASVARDWEALNHPARIPEEGQETAAP